MYNNDSIWTKHFSLQWILGIYQRNVNVSNRQSYSVYVNGQIYIFSNGFVIHKYDKFLNESFIQTNRSDSYRGLYFNPTNGLIYVATYNNSNTIFDQNLSFVRS